MIAARPLWLLAVLLAVGVAAEWLQPPATVEPDRPPAVTAPRPAGLAEAPAPDWPEIALARPLFSPSRRPDGGTAAPGPASAPRAGLPRLSGILVTGGRPVALFAAGAAGRSTAVSVGGTVESWTVAAIRPDGVTLTGPDGPVSVRPSYSNAPPRTEPVAPPAAAPLLPPIPQTDTRPFEMMSQPSGASIFGHVAAPSGQPAPGPAIPVAPPR